MTRPRHDMQPVGGFASAARDDPVESLPHTGASLTNLRRIDVAKERLELDLNQPGPLLLGRRASFLR